MSRQRWLFPGVATRISPQSAALRGIETRRNGDNMSSNENIDFQDVPPSSLHKPLILKIQSSFLSQLQSSIEVRWTNSTLGLRVLLTPGCWIRYHEDHDDLCQVVHRCVSAWQQIATLSRCDCLHILIVIPIVISRVSIIFGENSNLVANMIHLGSWHLCFDLHATSFYLFASPSFEKCISECYTVYCDILPKFLLSFACFVFCEPLLPGQCCFRAVVYKGPQ